MSREMGKFAQMFEGPDNRLSFSRIWGSAFSSVVIVLYIWAFFSTFELPPETFYMLGLGLAPYVTTQTGHILIKIIELYQKR